MGEHYFDNSSTTRVCDEAAAKVMELMTQYEMQDSIRSVDINKAYDMRVRRAPTVYTDEEFQKWKAHAEQARDLYVDGKLTYNQLKALTELPPRK